VAKEEQHNDEVGMSRYTKVVAAYSLESQGLRVGAVNCQYGVCFLENSTTLLIG
jgi:hypothetical protein